MLGCRLNQAEIDAMARQFQLLGHEVVADPAQAEQIVVNTCAVTQDASHSSRQLVRQLHRANESSAISVTGCYTQIEPHMIATLPGVARVVDNAAKDQLVERVTGQSPPLFDAEPLARAPDSVRAGRIRAFVKVQDGCDNACTFCVTTVARGVGRSRPVQDVLREIRMLLMAGYHEIVLTGVHLGSYGHNLGEERGLFELVRAILLETDTPRLRLSSLEPWDLTQEFFDLWQDSRLCRHIHLPLQSGCDGTLRRMARRTTQAQFRDLVHAIRARVPEMAITSDVIVGFPGETDEEFAISMQFVETMDFAGLHVFRYSKRSGTPAARMRGHVPEDVKRARSKQMLAHAEAQEQRYAERFAGQTLEVAWEQIAGVTDGGFINVGYTDNYIRMRCVHPRVLTHLLLPARLETFDPIGRQMIGALLVEEDEKWMIPEQH
jgi:threonylcarbamoyladenosine tRNA methylthiotransferase MtaB